MINDMTKQSPEEFLGMNGHQERVHHGPDLASGGQVLGRAGDDIVTAGSAFFPSSLKNNNNFFNVRFPQWQQLCLVDDTLTFRMVVCFSGADE